jgi:hypothetical protein
MATTITKTPDSYRVGGYPNPYNTYSGGEVQFGGTLGALEFGIDSLVGFDPPVSACNLALTLSGLVSGGSRVTVLCTAYGFGTNGGQIWTATQSFTWDTSSATQHTFTFSKVYPLLPQK